MSVKIMAEIFAHQYAVANGIFGYDLRVCENRKAALRGVPAWDVYVRPFGVKKGKNIVSVVAYQTEILR